MASWPSQLFSERRLKIKYYRSYSSSEASWKQVVVYEDDVLVRITIVGSSFQCDNVLKTEVDNILLTRINKTLPMNIIICLPQSNIHRTTQVDINSSLVSRLSKVSNSSSFPLSICRICKSKIDGRKPNIRNRWKVQRIVDKLFNCGRPNQKLLTVEEVLRNPDHRQTNELISSSISNSSSNTLNHYLLFLIIRSNIKQVYQEYDVLLYPKPVYVVRLTPIHFVKVVKGESQSHVQRTV